MANPRFASPFPTAPLSRPRRTGLPGWAIAAIVGSGLLLVAVAVVLVLAVRSLKTLDAPDPTSTPVRDRQFQFVVGPAKCSTASIGNHRPHGKFCVVTVVVENTGNRARSFAAYNQVAFDAEGNRFEAHALASGRLNRDGPGSLEDLNPGVKVTVRVAFDVGPDVKLTSLMLHDSMLSGGARVNLP